MFLPFGDFPNPTKPQWVTRILLGLNVLVFVFFSLPLSSRGLDPEFLSDPDNYRAVAEMKKHTHDPAYESDREWFSYRTQYDVMIWRLGYRPAAGGLLSLLTCMFLHAGFLHLLGNMLYLWIFGDNVEARLGPVLYTLVYFGTGALATLAFAVMNSDSMIPLVGASGAISGVLGLYLIWFPFNQIRVILFLFLFFTVVHVPAIYVLGAYLLIDNLLPLLAAGESAVAYGAHLGGFVSGALVAVLWNLFRGTVPPPRPRPYVGPRRALRRQPPPDPHETLVRSVEAGRMEEAAHAFAQVVRGQGKPADAQATFRLGNWLYTNSFIADAAAVFRYYVKHYPRGADLDRAHLGLGILLSRHLGQPVAAREHLLSAIDLADESSTIQDTARAELDRIGG